MATTKYIVNNLSGQTINGESVMPQYKVYTALLTQDGTSTEDSISAGTLTIGVTYYINEESTGMDFTNVGAPNNDLGTYFVATGTTPSSWGSGANYTLGYDAGAPVVTVLENTIGNVWFTYNSVGSYMVRSNALFPGDKTTCIASQSAYNDTGTTMIYRDGESEIYIETYGLSTQTAANNILVRAMLEIRVYN
jgi:hypothetical protein